MKKLSKITGSFAIALAIVSCNKEEIATTEQKNQNLPEFVEVTEQKLTPIETEKISIENGVLMFESIEFYQSIVDFEDYSKIAFTIKHLNSLEFNSYGKANPESKLFDDEFMNAILNADQVVKIGDWFIRINPETKKVFAASSSIENAYDIVARETESNNAVLTFATRDNVLEALPQEGMMQKNGLCGESGVGEREHGDYYGNAGPWDPTNYCFLRHKKFGIYFKIQTECTSPIVPNQRFWITYEQRQYKKTCDPLVNMGSGTVWSPIVTAGWNDVLTQGTKNFNKYWVKITAAGRGTVNYAGVFIYEANISVPYLQIRVNM